jgi:hypothetical protein
MPINTRRTRRLRITRSRRRGRTLRGNNPALFVLLAFIIVVFIDVHFASCAFGFADGSGLGWGRLLFHARRLGRLLLLLLLLLLRRVVVALIGGVFFDGLRLLRWRLWGADVVGVRWWRTLLHGG